VATSATASVPEWQAGENLGSPLGSLESISSVAKFGRGNLIYLSGEPADYWYRILSGTCRKYAFGLDGRRQIVDFPRPGDLFGYDAEDVHAFSVEAIVSNTTIARYPRRDAELVANSEPGVSKRIRELAFASVYRLEKRMLILGRASSLEKVSNFLLEMAQSFRPISGQAVALPMSRHDIADYLAMAVETVSRVLTSLRDMGAIQFYGCRCVRIRDRCLLEGALESRKKRSPALVSAISVDRASTARVGMSRMGLGLPQWSDRAGTAARESVHGSTEAEIIDR
jgi:CRP/FNR family nitrogen fixation transcriptional regulator